MEINICFGLSDDYSQHCACAIASLLYNSNRKDKYNIYLISDFISEGNRISLEKLKNIRNFNLNYLIIDPSEYKDLVLNNNLGYSTFFRLKAFEYFNFDKVLYLDTDMIIRRDLRELWETDIDGYYCAGAEDLVAYRKIEELGFSKDMYYINAGMLLINLKYSREMNVVQKFKDFFSKPWDPKFNDQEIINYIFQLKIKPVDITWNLTPYASLYEDQNHFNQVMKNPAIIHYIGWQKPWDVEANPHMKSEYFKYLRLTPYFEGFMFQYELNYRQIILAKLTEIKNAILENNSD